MIEGRHGFMVYNQYCHWIGKALELYGEYCEHEIDLFAKILKPTDNVWEIGANTGSQSPALARCVGQGRYVGFEPQIELYKIFVTNLTLNNCENSLPLNFALGEHDGVIELPPVDYHQPNNFGGVSLLGRQSGAKDKVEIRRIDSLSWLPSPNFIKIDVEGMESIVLRGGVNTIKRMTPIIYIENDRVDKSPELIQLLWDMGYKCYWHITPYYNEKNFFANRSNIYCNKFSFNMICIHIDRGLKVEGLQIVTNKDDHPLRR